MNAMHFKAARLALALAGAQSGLRPLIRFR